MKKPIAAFDIDGTLLPTASSERLFVRYLVSHGELTLTDAARFVARFLTTWPRDPIRATKANKAYLRGKPASRIQRLAADCFARQIIPAISSIARETVTEHKAAGREIVLVSGTIDVLLDLFEDHLDADHAHGTALEVMGGLYTGNIASPHLYGRAKADLVRAVYDTEKYDLGASYAYGNHETDLAFLELFGHPALVNPDARLAVDAERRGVDVLRF